MAIFVTLDRLPGSYLAADSSPSTRQAEPLDSRETEQEAREGWTSLQLHFEFPEFAEYLNTRWHFSG